MNLGLWRYPYYEKYSTSYPAAFMYFNRLALHIYFKI